MGPLFQRMFGVGRECGYAPETHLLLAVYLSHAAARSSQTPALGPDFSEVPFLPMCQVGRTHLASWRSGPYPFLSLPQNHSSAFVVGLTRDCLGGCSWPAKSRTSQGTSSWSSETGSSVEEDRGIWGMGPDHLLLLTLPTPLWLES